MQPTRTNHAYPDTIGRGRSASGRIPLSIALLSAGFASFSLSPAAAQTAASTPQTTAASSDAIKQREQELEAARTQQKNAADAQEKLKSEITSMGQDRSKLNQQLIDIAAQVRGVETRIGDAEARLRPLDSREQQIRSSLDSRRSEIVEVLAALQRAGRRTPPALLVRPEDALQSLRTAMLLGAVVPELRSRAEKLTGDLTELVSLRKTIATERDRLAADRDKLRDDQTRLAALVDERQRQQSSIEKDMETEGARAITLSRQVDSLQGLIAKMEQDLKSAAKAAETASLQGAPAALNGKPNLGALKDPARLSPAIAFASARGLFALPVNGVKIRDFGGSDGAGGVEKGISLATRPGAQVTTPCDGWVVYAGPFRSYGQLLILNAGGGYHVLIAGMERISVNIGQFVLTGEPVAIMGTVSRVASILATNASQPVLYVEFRKDGTPIDPGPWWAANEGEKVRG
ncbi:murein hydrolase activator EnvC family protein [Bradyrhizobium erythrophlei]|uniref:Septal ring factor EnvC, activator of murein hydrolases AmiA and AmiB n=1 Tax=Bradyrhizobium erythrophlei TaxID=1437360 RepID=A0A1M5JII3_9BRAD|nr:peptidoglycan DD-metalloendopeptidase family protein [Bradyrhizobium erythrophlei]SHG39843.1 Septal ring factor EnvC, activator of murein hydrolases AmiA and AmiB [Bradyrhizobium erythrophlei]